MAQLERGSSPPRHPKVRWCYLRKLFCWIVAALLFLSPVQVSAERLTFAPQPFPTLENLFYDTYFDLQSSVRRLGEYHQKEAGPVVYQLWSYNHEFNLDDIPHIPFLFSYKIVRVYVQVQADNGKPFFRIMLEEVEYRGKKEYVHHVSLEDHNMNAMPDVIEEGWLVINKTDGRRFVEDMKSTGDKNRGKDRIDKRWNYWFGYWIKVQVLEFKETFKLRAIPDREV